MDWVFSTRNWKISWARLYSFPHARHIKLSKAWSPKSSRGSACHVNSFCLGKEVFYFYHETRCTIGLWNCEPGSQVWNASAQELEGYRPPSIPWIPAAYEVDDLESAQEWLYRQNGAAANILLRSSAGRQIPCPQKQTKCDLLDFRMNRGKVILIIPIALTHAKELLTSDRNKDDGCEVYDVLTGWQKLERRRLRIHSTTACMELFVTFLALILHMSILRTPVFQVQQKNTIRAHSGV